MENRDSSNKQLPCCEDSSSRNLQMSQYILKYQLINNNKEIQGGYIGIYLCLVRCFQKIFIIACDMGEHFRTNDSSLQLDI